jgi:hypothetical protein
MPGLTNGFRAGFGMQRLLVDPPTLPLHRQTCEHRRTSIPVMERHL